MYTYSVNQCTQDSEEEDDLLFHSDAVQGPDYDSDEYEIANDELFADLAASHRASV